jgi:hypothetical protein
MYVLTCIKGGQAGEPQTYEGTLHGEPGQTAGVVDNVGLICRCSIKCGFNM